MPENSWRPPEVWDAVPKTVKAARALHLHGSGRNNYFAFFGYIISHLNQSGFEIMEQHDRLLITHPNDNAERDGLKLKIEMAVIRPGNRQGFDLEITVSEASSQHTEAD